MRRIEWTGLDGTRNVFVGDAGLIFPPLEPLLPHDFEAQRYMRGRESIVSDTCWCHAKADHPIHALVASIRK